MEKYISVELWISGEYYDTFDWFDGEENPEVALLCAQEDAEYRDQEWWDENYGYDDESLMGFTDWEIKLVMYGNWE